MVHRAVAQRPRLPAPRSSGARKRKKEAPLLRLVSGGASVEVKLTNRGETSWRFWLKAAEQEALGVKEVKKTSQQGGIFGVNLSGGVYRLTRDSQKWLPDVTVEDTGSVLGAGGGEHRG